MSLLSLVEILAALVGLVVSITVFVFPRFGSASWILGLSLAPGFMSTGVLGVGPLIGWLPNDLLFLAFSCLVISSTGGCLTGYTLERENYLELLKNSRWFFVGLSLAAPVLIAALYMLRPAPGGSSESLRLVAFGSGGYAAAVYLLLVSVISLANLEQILRGAEEHVRWEIKFLLLGLASTFGSFVYVASQILLYPPEHAYLPFQAIHVFPPIFLCSCLLILLSWRRSTGRGRVVVSQGVVYSTITLFGVGVYLITSSLVARWVTQWTQPDLPLGPIIFLLSAIVLCVVLLGTAFRHRLRRWIRRNLFSGKYDYRQLWMDAAERVRSTDSPPAAAAVLAELIEGAIGALDVSVWLRSGASGMRLIAARGTIRGSLPNEAAGLASLFAGITEPIEVSKLGETSARDCPRDYLAKTKASVLVPLISSGRLVGLLTVGPDRSGKPFDSEAREFLRVIAVHAASEFHKSELLETLVSTREAEAFRTFSTFLLHDLKNFASTLSLIAKNAARHHGNPDFQHDAFQSILDTAEQMKRLCNGLRTFSTTLAANKQPDDLNDIVREVSAHFESAFGKSIQLDLHEVSPALIDRQEISRVLQNLMLNAREAAPEALIRVSSCEDEGGIVISVIDNGPGIPSEFMENGLFQPFHTTKGDGLGIGLFQSKRIIESHGGVIEVDSKEGAGTTVRIVLPVSKTGAELALNEIA
jgi:putative PEP-CTERM system histidine kinase